MNVGSRRGRMAVTSEGVSGIVQCMVLEARDARRLGTLLGALMLIALYAPSAEAASSPKIELTATPAAVEPRAALTVSGEITGHLGALSFLHRVVLEERTGSRWTERAHARLGRNHDFALRWRVPNRAQTLSLRVRLIVLFRTRAISRIFAVNVMPPSPTPTQTLVIDPATVKAAPTPGEGGTLRLAGRVATRPGDILGSGVGEAAPFGFLLKVTSVRTEDADTIITVVPATLLEAIPVGSFQRVL